MIQAPNDTFSKVGFSPVVSLALLSSLEAAEIAVWARVRWKYYGSFRKSFFWGKKDGSICSLGDILVTRKILGDLGLPAVAEENMSQWHQVAKFCLSRKNYGRLFTEPDGLILDGIDGTLDYVHNRPFSIWMGGTKYGQPWWGIFVRVGQIDEGIQQIVVAEKGKGAWLLERGLHDWKRITVPRWTWGQKPTVGHGLPFSRDPRFRDYADFLCGPNFQGQRPSTTQIVPIGVAGIEVILGRVQLYSHALLPVWDWFPLQVFMTEVFSDQSGKCINLYSIDENGKATVRDDGFAAEDLSPTSRLSLNIGVPEFVDIAKSYLTGQKCFFKQAGSIN